MAAAAAIQREQIREVAETAVAAFEEWAADDIKPEAHRLAPDTTPDIPIRYGSLRTRGLLEINIIPVDSQVEFLEAITIAYLYEEQGFSGQVEGYTVVDGIDHVNRPISPADVSFRGSIWAQEAGTHVYSEDAVFMNFVPDKFRRGPLEQRLQQEGLRSTQMAEPLLSAMDKLSAWTSGLGNPDYRQFLATVCHELTHRYIAHHTLSQRIFEEISMDDASSDDLNELAASILDDEQSGKEVVRDLWNEGPMESVNEGFAWFTGGIISGDLDRYVNEEEERSEEGFYYSIEQQQWVANILQDAYFREDTDRHPIDWARLRAADVFDDMFRYYAHNIIQKETPDIYDRIYHDVDISGYDGPRHPLAIFLKHMLPPSEQARLEQYREIVRHKHQDVFQDLHRLVDQLQEEEVPDGIEQFKENWEQTRMIDQRVLKNVLKVAVRNLWDIDETHNELNEQFSQEVEFLQDEVDLLHDMYDEVEDDQLKDEIETSAEEIEEVGRALADLVR